MMNVKKIGAAKIATAAVLSAAALALSKAFFRL